MSTIFFFQHIYVHLNEKLVQIFLWNHMSQTFQLQLKWDNQFIFNIWRSTPSSFAIIWIIFRIYFALCNISWQHINFHKCHLMLIKNVVSFDNCIIWLLNYLILNTIYENLFQYWLGGSWKLHSFRKQYLWLHFLATVVCFHLKKVFMYLKHIIHYLYHRHQEQGF
jgi:hypothetical protein